MAQIIQTGVLIAGAEKNVMEKDTAGEVLLANPALLN
jgi:hypothetical protein